MICTECLVIPNAPRQTVKSKVLTLAFHQQVGNIRPGASNIKDVFADDTVPVMVYAACKALENEISNLTSSYRAEIDALKKDWKDDKFFFQPRYQV